MCAKEYHYLLARSIENTMADGRKIRSRHMKMWRAN